MILAFVFFESQWFRILAPAILATVATHFLAKKREKSNSNNEILKNFYYKIIPEIYDYFSTENDFKRWDTSLYNREQLDTQQFKRNALMCIKDNVFYINTTIHNSYRVVMKNQYKDDLSGIQHQMDELNLFYIVIEEYIKLNRKSKQKDKNLDLASNYACLFLIWRNATYFIEGDTYVALSVHFYFNQKKMNRRMARRLKRLDNIKNYAIRKSNFRSILLELIDHEMEESQKKEFLDMFFEIGPEVSDNFSIYVQMNLDAPDIGPLPLHYRKQYRYFVLNELYNSKYYDSKYKFEFKIDNFNELYNEYKDALNYWSDKNFASIIYNENLVTVRITALGEDYIENQTASN